MPLIRYDLGDMGIQNRTLKCDCGRKFPIIEKIIGRQDDYLKTVDGMRVGRLDPVFKGAASIINAQIIQHTIRDVEIKIVPGKKYKKTDGDSVIKEMKKRVGEDMNVFISIVDEIKKTRSGKFRSVIAKI